MMQTNGVLDYSDKSCPILTKVDVVANTVICLIEDASLIEDAPNLQPSFHAKNQAMKKGKLPDRRPTPLLEYFMSSF